jgi:hypothetical protein
VQKHKSLI